jgi:hypothetical protein
LVEPRGTSVCCIDRTTRSAAEATWPFDPWKKAMLDYLDERNKDPKPFVWTADTYLILGKVRRLSERISDSGHSSLKRETA